MKLASTSPTKAPLQVMFGGVYPRGLPHVMQLLCQPLSDTCCTKCWLPSLTHRAAGTSLQLSSGGCLWPVPWPHTLSRH